MSNDTAVPEPENTSRSFVRVIAGKAKAAAKRVGSLFVRGGKAAAHGTTWTLDAAARVIKVAAYVVSWGIALLVCLAFMAALALVMLTAKAVYLVVLVVRTPHLALFHRPALKADWSVFAAGLKPSRWALLTPNAILRDEYSTATVHDLLAHSRGKAALNPIVGDEGRVLDVEEAHEAALFEELERRDARRVVPAAEAPKGRPTPKQRKVRPAKLPRTA